MKTDAAYYRETADRWLMEAQEDNNTEVGLVQALGAVALAIIGVSCQLQEMMQELNNNENGETQ